MDLFKAAFHTREEKHIQNMNTQLYQLHLSTCFYSTELKSKTEN